MGFHVHNLLIVAATLEEGRNFVTHMEQLGEFDRNAREEQRRYMRFINTDSGGFVQQNMRGLDIRSCDVFITSHAKTGTFSADVMVGLTHVLARHGDSIHDCQEVDY